MLRNHWNPYHARSKADADAVVRSFVKEGAYLEVGHALGLSTSAIYRVVHRYEKEGQQYGKWSTQIKAASAAYVDAHPDSTLEGTTAAFPRTRVCKRTVASRLENHVDAMKVA